MHRRPRFDSVRRLRDQASTVPRRQLQLQELESRCLLTATSIVVNQFADVVNPTDGFTSLREAVIQANNTAGDVEIQLAAGTYALTRMFVGNDPTTGQLDISSSGHVFFIGTGAGATTIDANGLKASILVVNAGSTVSISGITLTNGEGGLAGAIFNAGTLSVTDCVITGNKAGQGGGAIASNGTLTVIGSTLSGNVAKYGGGAIFSLGQLELINSTLSNNTATDGKGGGIFQMAGELLIDGSTITGNTSEGYGGGISVDQGNVTIINSTLANNVAGDGGGIYTDREESSVSIITSTISGNRAGYGGGILSSGT